LCFNAVFTSTAVFTHVSSKGITSITCKTVFQKSNWVVLRLNKSHILLLLK
jgi:hypothetical protein